MGSALLRRWAESEDSRFATSHFFVIDPASGSEENSGRITYLQEPPPVEQCAFDLVIVAVKPQIVDKVLPDYVARMASDGFVASIAAGCSIERLSRLAGGAPVVRIMPNLPAAIGQGVSGLCAEPRVTALQRDAVQNLMAATGKTLWVEDEDKLDRLTAIAGSGPGYVFEIARAFVDAAIELGFSEYEARRLVLGTMQGSLSMALDSDLGLEDLRRSVTSKNGTTEAGLEALNADSGLSKRLQATVDAAYDRAVELR